MPVVRRLVRIAFSRTPISLQFGEAAGRFIDARLRIASLLRRQLNKVFPDNWSFMLAELASPEQPHVRTGRRRALRRLR
jgi:hypothetical protein